MYRHSKYPIGASMASCTTESMSATKVALVLRNSLIGSGNAAIKSLSQIDFRSIICKTLCTNVFFTESELNQRLVSPCHHAWRSANVIDWILQITDVVREHPCVDGTG